MMAAHRPRAVECSSLDISPLPDLPRTQDSVYSGVVRKLEGIAKRRDSNGADVRQGGDMVRVAGMDFGVVGPHSIQGVQEGDLRPETRQVVDTHHRNATVRPELRVAAVVDIAVVSRRGLGRGLLVSSSSLFWI